MKITSNSWERKRHQAFKADIHCTVEVLNQFKQFEQSEFNPFIEHLKADKVDKYSPLNKKYNDSNIIVYVKHRMEKDESMNYIINDKSRIDIVATVPQRNNYVGVATFSLKEATDNGIESAKAFIAKIDKAISIISEATLIKKQWMPVDLMKKITFKRLI